MKAAYLIGPNIPLEIREIPIPEPGKGEIRVRIKYAALNHRDLWTCLGQYRGKSENLILGSDASGWVDALGEEVESWSFGEEVLINPSLHWGEDEKVQGSSFQILGNPSQGTFAEYVVVPAVNVFRKPSYLSMEEGAALPLAGLTAFRALFTRGKLKKGDHLLVTGIGGGAAQMAMQMGIAAGASVWVSSSQAHKIENAKRLGAMRGYMYTDPQWVEEAMHEVPGGFDLIVDSASGKGFSDLIEICKPGGSLVFFGGTSGSIGPLVPAKIFWRQINILGTTMGSSKEFKDLIQFYENHQIKPQIDSIYSLKDIQEALQRMRLGDQNGKIILNVRG